MNSLSLAGTEKYEDGADRIEILDSILDQICTQSMFSRQELKTLLLEWVNCGYWWAPSDSELIFLIAGDI